MSNSPSAAPHLDAARREIAARRPREALAHLENAIGAAQDAETLAVAGAAILDAAMQLDGPDFGAAIAWAEAVLIGALGQDFSLVRAREALRKVGAVRCNGAAGDEHRPEVAELLSAGTRSFSARRFAEAEQLYTRAVALDPADATAHKYLGNTYYAQERVAEAIPHFRRATELGPRDPQAFKFLADALFQAKDFDALPRALYGAIAAHPCYWGAWIGLHDVRSSMGRPLQRYRLRPAAEPHRDPKTGKLGISVHAWATDALRVAWMVHATAWIDRADAGATPFECELAGFTVMAQHIAELGPRASDLPPDVALLPEMEKRGDLRPMVLLLRYRDAFRAELEAYKERWGKASGDPLEAVQNFVVRTRMRPI